MVSQSQSRYAPPNANLEPDREGRTGGTGRFAIGSAFSDAWAATWANFPLWLGVGIVWLLAVAAAALSVVGIVLALPVLSWGIASFALGMHDRRARFGDAFAGFRRYGAALGPMLLILVVSVAAGMPGQALAQVGLATKQQSYLLAGVVLNLAVGFLVTPRWLFAQFLVVEEGLRGMQALRRSWQLTRPVRWRIIGLLLVGGVVVMAGALFLLVGAIPAGVIAFQMIVSAYRQVVGGPQPALL